MIELPHPFLKWVGGKRQLLPELTSRLPASFNSYHEPFVGGGALFFHLARFSHLSRQFPKLNSPVFLSDTNPELISAYEVVRDDVESLIEDLKQHIYDRDYYYQIRNSDRSPEFVLWSAVKRASRLIYLNKTCFNGLYRVNSQGQFNVPIGRYKNPRIVDEENLRACSQSLKSAQLSSASFQISTEKCQPGDFVYFDPPYAPLSQTADFTGYTQGGFGIDRQEELRDTCVSLHKRDVKFMVSNSDVPLIRKLYQNFRIETVQVSRAVNSNSARRGKVDEVIIRNY